MIRIFLFLFLFASPLLFSQNIDLQFVDSDSTDCTANSFCVDLQIKGNSGADYLGISSIVFEYDPTVILFNGDALNGVTQGSYHSINFDNVGSSPECNTLGPGYAAHAFDGLSAGDFLITVIATTTIGTNIFACPAIGNGWVTMSTICFDIIDPNGNPNLVILGNQGGPPSPTATGESNFNSDTNDPVDKYDNGVFTPYTGNISAACSGCTESIALTLGWNLISTNCEPANLDMEAIFASIEANVIEVKDLTDSYAPFYDYNEIGNWDMTSSYRVNMRQQDTLEISGNIVDAANTPINLSAGWNLIPYFLDVNGNPATIFASIAGSIIEVQDLNGVYNPNTGMNTLNPMMPTEGFQIKMSAPATLIYTP